MANTGCPWYNAILATLLIVGATLYKTSVLSGGGGRVALDMGGTLVPTDVTDPLRRRLRNVVEEMAIASGVPVPEIYVMESESAINAFAAGFAPGDAAVAVTRGTLELLNREELQGVIAHEFSHILNGDMRLEHSHDGCAVRHHGVGNHRQDDSSRQSPHRLVVRQAKQECRRHHDDRSGIDDTRLGRCTDCTSD